jgi:hypothetical protein
VIKLDVIMLAIWMAAAVVLGTVDVGIATWQYWAMVVCLVSVEIRAGIVVKEGLK